MRVANQGWAEEPPEVLASVARVAHNQVQYWSIAETVSAKNKNPSSAIGANKKPQTAPGSFLGSHSAGPSEASKANQNSDDVLHVSAPEKDKVGGAFKNWLASPAALSERNWSQSIEGVRELRASQPTDSRFVSANNTMVTAQVSSTAVLHCRTSSATGGLVSVAHYNCLW